MTAPSASSGNPDHCSVTFSYCPLESLAFTSPTVTRFALDSYILLLRVSGPTRFLFWMVTSKRMGAWVWPMA